ncbi:hypothetical protein CIPAW_06G129900 [Carya illinoinensis]|uniref:Uncharacterized protein n=1 Tax=Carya illinoinensis TaxID=32201 RepID=A0A8T1QB22_CARIL|nr:hypothetical protein CIPAW_06G129900 [Carya illinoinensis]
MVERNQMESVGDCSCAGSCNRANLMPIRLFLNQEKAQTQRYSSCL